MVDREKVIKALEKCSFRDCPTCPYYSPNDSRCIRELIYDALTLLKEQPEIVRCKDCKYGGKINQVHEDAMYLCHRSVFFSSAKCVHLHGADWFCADGEKKGATALQ